MKSYVEVIKQDLQPYPISQRLIEVKCEKRGLKPESEATNSKGIILAEIDILVQFLSLASISEGGESRSYDRKAAEAYLRLLCAEAGIDSTEYIEQPTVKYLGDW